MRKHESTQDPYFMATDYDMGEGGEKKRATKNVDHIIFQAFLVTKSCIGEMHSPSLKSLVAHKVGLKSNPSISEQCLRSILLP
jgi:hypothetical protein